MDLKEDEIIVSKYSHGPNVCFSERELEHKTETEYMAGYITGRKECDGELDKLRESLDELTLFKSSLPQGELREFAGNVVHKLKQLVPRKKADWRKLE